MLYIFGIDENSNEILNIEIVDNKVLLNKAAINTIKTYANIGKDITVIKCNTLNILNTFKFNDDKLVLNVTKNPQSSSFFEGLSNIFKPASFNVSYCTIGDDIYLFFEDVLSLEYFIHEKLSAKPLPFNEKNDSFNFIMYDYTREMYLSGGYELILDVFAHSYFKLNIEGAEIEDIVDDGIVIPITLNAMKNGNQVDNFTVGYSKTDTFKVTFPSKGMYLVNVKTLNGIYDTQHYIKVFVC